MKTILVTLLIDHISIYDLYDATHPYGDLPFKLLHLSKQGRHERGFSTADVTHHCQQRTLRHHHVNADNRWQVIVSE